jgi:uncharacterized protein YfkK (UPF0435 family)
MFDALFINLINNLNVSIINLESWVFLIILIVTSISTLLFYAWNSSFPNTSSISSYMCFVIFLSQIISFFYSINTNFIIFFINIPLLLHFNHLTTSLNIINKGILVIETYFTIKINTINNYIDIHVKLKRKSNLRLSE